MARPGMGKTREVAESAQALAAPGEAVRLQAAGCRLQSGPGRNREPSGGPEAADTEQVSFCLSKAKGVSVAN